MIAVSLKNSECSVGLNHGTFQVSYYVKYYLYYRHFSFEWSKNRVNSPKEMWIENGKRIA